MNFAASPPLSFVMLGLDPSIHNHKRRMNFLHTPKLKKTGGIFPPFSAQSM
ncbi:hypothetical protein GB928_001655 [Shinella curvata]|uniref:Uncharacterized protein n=1 Tax=Shinella curvata TaxID=1817964 RepID=A0ABT8X866_9HYPH|nr:hypothetical protein [Shinella curvata]MCJ8052171.1 hypothetical protein [Shinella curvata]MDO6119881.1 hypothetical protein [Shinella curvata]